MKFLPWHCVSEWTCVLVLFPMWTDVYFRWASLLSQQRAVRPGVRFRAGLGVPLCSLPSCLNRKCDGCRQMEGSKNWPEQISLHGARAKGFIVLQGRLPSRSGFVYGFQWTVGVLHVRVKWMKDFLVFVISSCNLARGTLNYCLLLVFGLSFAELQRYSWIKQFPFFVLYCMMRIWYVYFLFYLFSPAYLFCLTELSGLSLCALFATSNALHEMPVCSYMMCVISNTNMLWM